MSTFDQASLVMIPSGYKASKVYSIKPTDGSGDMSFSRSNDTATRVNSAGLIEKVRTNLILQSQAFDTADWAKSAISVTANSVANPLDAVVNADTIVGTAGTTQKYIGAANTFNGQFTFSVYAKYVSQQFVQVFLGADATPFANFDIQTGAVSASGSTASIVSVGSGWYRLSITFTSSTGSGIYLLNVDSLAAARFTATSSTGSYYAFGAQLETGDIATDYIATTSAAVSVGPVANVPRLDYLNSSCPRLLLEPQRTNLITFSESFNNAAWTKTAAGTGVTPVVTANSAISPDGYQNADTIVFNVGAGTTSSDQSYINQTLSVTSGSTYSFSVYLKGSVGGEQLIIRSVSGSYTLLTLSNEWQRFSVTAAAASTGYAAHFGLRQGVAGTLNSTATVYAYGAQVELGSYVSSYVNTLGASVTRGADDFTKTGISSLIGQTEGTLFVDFIPANTPVSGVQQWLFFLGSGGTYIGFLITSGGKLRGNVANTTDQAVIDTSYNLVSGTTYKAALAYKQNDFALYVNGVQIGLDTSGTVPAVSSLRANYNTTAANSSNAGLNQALLFKTRLTNDSLAELTSL